MITSPTAAPVSNDRTDEFYARLDQSAGSAVHLYLEGFDYILAPRAEGGRSRKVYGPANILAYKDFDGRINITATLTGKAPEPRLPDTEPA